MDSPLGPWPFLTGGAAAVEVTTELEGDVVARECLWAGGAASARDCDGAALVRRAESGEWELLLLGARGARDGEVVVGGRSERLRVLAMCGVTAVPLSPATRATLRAGAGRIVVAGTEAPVRRALGRRWQWRRGAALLTAALVVAAWAATLRLTTARRRAWDFAALRRARVALALPALPGGHAAAPLANEPAATTKTAKAKAVKAAKATPASAHERHHDSNAAKLRAHAAHAGRRAAKDVADDAPRAAAMQARADGFLGVSARERTLLGNVFAPAAAVAGDAGAGSTSGGDATGGGLGEEAETVGVGELRTSGGGGNGDGEGFGGGGEGFGGDEGFGGLGDGFGLGCPGLGGHSARAPDVVVGSAVASERCDAAMIQRVVRAHLAEVRFCYERSLQSRPELRGRVVTRFTIASDGRVRDAAIAESTVGDAAVDACIAAALARWLFPACPGEVRYPFALVPAGSD